MSAPTTGPGIPITYGGGRCAACGCKTRAGNLMCGRHWGQVPVSLQVEVYAALRQWNVNLISLEDLRSVQAKAVEAVTGKPQVPTLEGSEATDA